MKLCSGLSALFFLASLQAAVPGEFDAPEISVHVWYGGALLILTGCLIAVLWYFQRFKAEAEQERIACQNQTLLIGLSQLDYFILNESGRFLVPPQSNHAWEVRNGIPVPPEKWIYPEDLGLFRSQIEALCSGKFSNVQFSYRVQREKEMNYFLTRIIALNSPSSGKRRFFGSIQDVTVTAKKEQLSEDLSRMAQALMDNLPYPIFAKLPDDDLRYCAVNTAFAETFAGIPREEIIGKTDHELPNLQQVAKLLRAHDRELLESGQEQMEFVEDIDIASGNYYYGKTQKKVLWLSEHKRILVGISVDISKEENAKRLLEDALNKANELNRAKSFFFACMSHEIRTPLNAVIGFSELLQNDDVPREERKQYLESINLAGNALLVLINDILDLSKLEAGQDEFQLRETDLHVLCNEMRAIFRHRMEEKNLAFEVKYPETLPKFLLDERRIRQILLNLLGNAVKFTPAGSVVLAAEWRAETADTGTLTLRVSDTGCGIDEEARQRIFEPFVQDGRNRDSRNQEGTGLGLAIVKRLVEHMNGTLELDSAVGRGSTFTISLQQVKYVTAETDTAAAAQTPQKEMQHRCCSIVIVDDVPLNLKVLGAMLKKCGQSFRSATSAEAAWKLLEQETPEFVLTDLWMPGTNGGELAKRIRSDSRFSEVKIYAVTADTDNSLNFSTGLFNGVLTKPFTIEQLKKVLFCQ